MSLHGTASQSHWETRQMPVIHSTNYGYSVTDEDVNQTSSSVTITGSMRIMLPFMYSDYLVIPYANVCFNCGFHHHFKGK